MSCDAPNSDDVSTNDVNFWRATLPPGSRTHTTISFLPSASLPGASAKRRPSMLSVGPFMSSPAAFWSALATLPPTAAAPFSTGICWPLIFAPNSRSRGRSPPTRP
jgi:hypothetical protein